MNPGRRVRRPVTLEGVGLFTGAPARLVIGPAEWGSGVRFRRADVPGAPAIPARVAHVAKPGQGPLAKLPSRNTCLLAPDHPGAFVLTIEHLMSALAALGVWDAAVELFGPEVPIADGSALPFVEALLGTGLEEGLGPEPMPVRTPVRLEAGAAWIEAAPGSGACRFEYRLDYGPGAPIAAGSAAWDLGTPDPRGDYRAGIAPARTFCLRAEAEAMRAAGLFGHLTPRDMLVIGDDGVPIENAYRFAGEPASHKLLDLIGDLALAGRPIAGTVVCARGGHQLTHDLVRAMAGVG